MKKLNIQKQVIGSCNCSNKTPEAKYHDELCYYRLLMEKTEPVADVPLQCEVIAKAPTDTDIEEINELSNLYNNGDIDFTSLLCRTWNKAYACGKRGD